MAESTRSKASPDRLEDAIAKLTTHHLAQPKTSSPSPFASNNPPTMVASTPHRLKLDVPCFDGTNPLGWIVKINQFFDYHATPKHDLLTITSFYMEGHDLAWFQWMTSNA